MKDLATESKIELRPRKRRRMDERNNVSFVYTGQLSIDIPINVTHITVDPSVREIRRCAFQGFRHLMSVEMAHVENIGDGAFYGCTSLTDFQFDQVKDIGRMAFGECKSLLSVEFARAGPTQIPPNAFRECTSLIFVRFAHGISSIGKNAFRDCLSLQSVELPSTLVEIQSAAFSGCIALADIEFQEGLKVIGPCAFIGCFQLGGIILPSSLEVLGNGSFKKCTNLLGVEFAKSSNCRFGVECFAECNALVNMSSISASNGVFTECTHFCDSNTLAILEERFDERLPVHKACHHSSSTTIDHLIRILDAVSVLEEKKDAFGMTPFHIVATSAKPRVDIFECLLTRYPLETLWLQDKYGKTMMDYLMKHTSKKVLPIIQMVLHKVIVDKTSEWGPNRKRHFEVARLDSENTNSAKQMAIHNTLDHAGYCLRVEMTSLLELASWNLRMSEGQHEDAGMDSRYRIGCRIQSQADVVVENVMGYLWGDESKSSTALSVFALFSPSRVQASSPLKTNA